MREKVSRDYRARRLLTHRRIDQTAQKCMRREGNESDSSALQLASGFASIAEDALHDFGVLLDLVLVLLEDANHHAIRGLDAVETGLERAACISGRRAIAAGDDDVEGQARFAHLPDHPRHSRWVFRRELIASVGGLFLRQGQLPRPARL